MFLRSVSLIRCELVDILIFVFVAFGLFIVVRDYRRKKPKNIIAAAAGSPSC